MEKIYFNAWRDSFEFRTKHGAGWTTDEIKNAYLAKTSNDPELLGRFETLEEAQQAIRDDFGNPMCLTSEQRGNIAWLLVGQIVYISEDEYDADEDGEEDFSQEICIHEFFAEAYPAIEAGFDYENCD